ncbi:protein ORF144 [Cyprinid herpesvirus 1]|uniref:Protein ORF144 n=1 Tax=Cyprinid herpesvirus 1 TaxID=317858 RepID=K7PBM7_9VIRU|nr:protein ORF144 [Cyprinid herpesvirus 1]AFJ20431.1 protein ORF144 [Cyprinid herpesvirus 1]
MEETPSIIPEDTGIETSLKCPACCDVLSRPVATPCGHTFCKACWERHLRAWPGSSKKICPICNQVVPVKLEVNKTLQDVVISIYGSEATSQEDEDKRPDLLDWRTWNGRSLPVHRPFKLEVEDLCQHNYWSVGVVVEPGESPSLSLECNYQADKYIYVDSIKSPDTKKLSVQYCLEKATLTFMDMDSKCSHVRPVPGGSGSTLTLRVSSGLGALCAIL